MDLFWLLLPIVIGSVLLGVSIGIVVTKALSERSPVERLARRRHFGV